MANPAPRSRELILEYIADTRSALDGLVVEQIQGIIEELGQAYAHGRQVLVVGNGGSAATASHLACDLSKTILGRPVDQAVKRFRVVSLAENMSLITAWANDASFDDVFVEQIKNLAQRDDLLVAITASGNSPNILSAVRVAKELGMRAIGLLGFDGGRVKSSLDRYVLVSSDHYGHVEDVHMMLVHLVTAYFREQVQRGAIK
jgi:D-sedoheptulose 7-phosphate isomerase